MDTVGNLANAVMALWLVGAGTVGVCVGGIVAWVNLKRDVREAKALATGTAEQVSSLALLTVSVARLEEKHESLARTVIGMAKDVRYMSRNMLLRHGAPKPQADDEEAGE